MQHARDRLRDLTDRSRFRVPVEMVVPPPWAPVRSMADGRARPGPAASCKLCWNRGRSQAEQALAGEAECRR